MDNLENKLEKSFIWSALVKFLRFGLIVSNILVTLIAFAAVIARSLDYNLLGYEEILIICAFWLYMLGSAYGSYERSHIKADIIVIMMKEGLLKDILSLVRDTLSVFLGIVFFLWAIQLFQWNLINDQATPVWRIPVIVGQSSLLFGLGVGSFFHLVYLYDGIKRFYLIWVKKIQFNDKND
ncbi:TRAP-type C4-dicarboxylate transport system, small permease component [Mesobacillus persicus]|uniref:TRAP-type C4-dicarboxylate transport system, small permease component n=1 Tax=Mesobacillus persicus TaxID=930146 RepID=A0A1H8AU56_9BACI|nr:TRAP transporter small permease [Mesobacillus persicus]SEM74282.1 TRAP-type C4-dicarboxylate transport system, small permease component [Mesobacillus persicus]